MRCNRFQVVLAIAAVTLFALAVSANAAVTEDDLRAWGSAQPEPFRLLMVTSTGRDATSADIADYNAFVDAAADNPGSIVSFLGTNWKALMDGKDGPRWYDNIGLSLTSSGSYATATIDDPVFLLNGVAPGLYRYYNGGPYLPDPPNVPINVTEQGDTLAGLGYVWTGSRNTLGDATGRPGNFGKTLHRCFDDDAWRSNTEIHSLYAMSDLLDPSAFAAGPVIPEPSTLVIWGLGLLALAWYARRKRTK